MDSGPSELDSLNPESSELESAAAELYAADPDDFIPRRTELVRAARLTGSRALATAIGKLRKPTRSAWLVNLYARSAPDELDELLELGAALRVAQEQLSAADLRQLSGQRNTILAAATRRASALAEARGYRASESVRQEVSQTLQAALADPAVAEQVRAGAVTEAHAYGGFGPLTFPASAAPATSEVADHLAFVGDTAASDGPASDTAPDEAERKRAVQAREEQLRAEQARAEAEHRLQTAETALDQAVDRADEVAEQVTELAEQLAALQSQVRDIEQAKAQAEQRADVAQSTVAELQARVREARAAYESL